MTSSDLAPGTPQSLPGIDPPLNASALESLCEGRFGHRVFVYDELDSTNRALYALGLEGAAEGTLVLAERQLQGRGRLGRAWASPPGGNLYLSLLLRPKIKLARAGLLSLLAAVAGRESFLDFELDVGIKWPNDLVVGPDALKICGVLSELRGGSSGIDFVVLGVGFNLNLQVDALGSGFRGIATSYLSQTGKTVSRAHFLAAFLRHLENGYSELNNGIGAPLLDRWRAGSATLGREVRFEIGGRSCNGIARDIDSSGALLIEGPEGQARVSAGDVRLVATRE